MEKSFRWLDWKIVTPKPQETIKPQYEKIISKKKYGNQTRDN